MKKTFLFILRVYKTTLSPILHTITGTGHACRYLPTCSEFARIHIVKEGILVGGARSFVRLLYCQPFVKKLPLWLEK